MFTGPTPSITAAQAASFIGWIVAQAVAYGWLSTQTSQLAVSIGATVLAAALNLADAHLRGKRATAIYAAQPAPVLPPPPVTPAA